MFASSGGSTISPDVVVLMRIVDDDEGATVDEEAFSLAIAVPKRKITNTMALEVFMARKCTFALLENNRVTGERLS